MDERHQEVLSATRVWGGAAAILVLLVAFCAKPDPTPTPRTTTTGQSEFARCERPMDSIKCLEEHHIKRNREKMLKQMQDEGLIDK
jgi:hypothetical protein